MRQTPAAVKVGSVVIAGSLLLLASSFFLQKSSMRGRAYSVRVGFADAQGVVPDSDLRMAGKKIGVVGRVDLANQDDPARDGRFLRNGRWVVITCRIREGYNIPAGSRWLVASNSIVGVPYVDIKPVPVGPEGYIAKNGTAEVLGAPSPSMASIMERAEASVGQAQTTLRNADLMMARVGSAADAATRLIGDPQVQQTLVESMRNVRKASENIRAMSQRLAALESRVEPSVTGMANDLKATTGSLRGAAGDVRPVMQRVRALGDELVETLRLINGTLEGMEAGQQIGDTLASVKRSAANAETVTANVAKASERLDAIMASTEQVTRDVASITSDPAVKADILGTLHGIRTTTEKASTLLDKLNMLGSNRTKLNLRTDSRVSGIGTLGNSDDSHFRLDYNATFSFGDNMVLAGLRSIGDGNRLNLQYGRLSAPLSFRAGLYSSKLGVGADYAMTEKDSMRAELWDHKNTHFDLYGQRTLGTGLGLVYGVEDIFDSATPAIGLTYRP